MAEDRDPPDVQIAEMIGQLATRLQAIESKQTAAMTDALGQISRGVEALRRLQADDALQSEIAALHRDIAAIQQRSGARPEPTPAAPTTDSEPRRPATAYDVPMTTGTEALLHAMESLTDVLSKLDDTGTLPESGRPLDDEFRNELFQHWQTVSEDFRLMMDRFLHEARSKYATAKNANKAQANPMAYWSGESLNVMNGFRTRLLVEKLFDPVELRVNQLKDSEYSRLLDQMTEMMDLRRIAIAVGRTPYDERFHECVDINPEQAGDTTQVQVVNRVLLSGYLDKSDDSVVRKAFVKTVVRAVGETQNLRTTLTPSSPKPGQKLTADIKNITVSDLGEVMVPSDVTIIRNQVTKLNGALSKVLGTDLPNELGMSVNMEVRAATMDLVARFYRQFSQFHERSKALAFLNYKRLKTSKAEGLTPASGWDEQMLYEYREYRHRRLMEDCLDRIEEKIMQLGMIDHLPTLDFLAQYMEVGRMSVLPNQTLYDPERHTVDSRMVTDRAALKGQPIVRLLLSGYVDLSTGVLIRKATVRIHG